MAEIIIPNGYTNAVLTWAMPGRVNPVSVTLGLTSNPAFTDIEEAEAVWDAAHGSTSIAPAPAMYTGISFTGVKVSRMIGGALHVAEWSVTTAGSKAGGSAVYVLDSTAFLVRKVTGLAGRKYRGRIYAPVTGWQQGNISTAGHWDDPAYGDVGDRWTVFFGALSTALLPPVLLHSHVDDEPTPLVGLNAQRFSATQRRRLR